MGRHLRFARHPAAIGKRHVSTGQGHTGHEVSLPLWFASEYVPARRKLCTSFLEQPGIPGRSLQTNFWIEGKRFAWLVAMARGSLHSLAEVRKPLSPMPQMRKHWAERLLERK